MHNKHTMNAKHKSTPLFPDAVLPYNVLVGKVLQRHRELLGLNQTEFAAAAGMKQSAYSRIETGQTALTLSQLHAIAGALGVKPEEIMKEVGYAETKLRARKVDVPLEKPEDGEAVKAALLIGLGVLVLVWAATNK